MTVSRANRVTLVELKPEHQLTVRITWIVILIATMPAVSIFFWLLGTWIKLDVHQPIKGQPGWILFAVLALALIIAWVLAVAVLMYYALAIVALRRGALGRQEALDLIALRYPQSWALDRAD